MGVSHEWSVNEIVPEESMAKVMSLTASQSILSNDATLDASLEDVYSSLPEQRDIYYLDAHDPESSYGVEIGHIIQNIPEILNDFTFEPPANIHNFIGTNIGKGVDMTGFENVAPGFYMKIDCTMWI